MNESDPFSTISLHICRICLKNCDVLSTMSGEHVDFYRTIVDEVAHEEYNMKTCIFCAWMLQKFTKFKHQCQSANNLLQEVVFMDSKSFIFLQTLTSSYHLTQNKLETHSYNPFKDPHNESNINGADNDFFQYKTENFINTFDDRITVDDTFKNENDVMNENSYDYGTNDNDMINENEDEIPLVLLRSTKGTKKKRKKKKKARKEMEHENKKDVKEEFDIVPETEMSNGTKVKCKRRQKVLRDGFTSRMVQETNEYTVIKLTKEQVLQEMEDRSKTDSYTQSLYRCELCVKGFNFKDVLDRHLEKHSTKNGAFKCDMCSQFCPSAVSLRGHVKSHTTRYKCKLCGHVRLSRQHLLEHHAVSHTGAPPSYKCDNCPFTSTSRTVMQRHARRHAGGAARACDTCGKLYKSIESLRVHTARQHGSAPRWACGCGRRFVQRSVLRAHAARDHYCVECDVHFASAMSLKLHFTRAKRHRDTTACKHSCPECPSRFFTRASLAAHLSAAHAAPRAHACAHCGRLYSSRDAARAHRWRAHSRRAPPVTCAHCDASFARKSTLKQHLRTHAGLCDAFEDKTEQLHLHNKDIMNGEAHNQIYETQIDVYTNKEI